MTVFQPRAPETPLSRCLTLSDFEAFADAAEEFHPHIRFYATFNTKVSQKNPTKKPPKTPTVDSRHGSWGGGGKC